MTLTCSDLAFVVNKVKINFASSEVSSLVSQNYFIFGLFVSKSSSNLIHASPDVD